MLKRLSIVSLAVALCAVTYTSDLAAAPVIARSSPVTVSRISYSPPPTKTYSPAPVKTLKTSNSTSITQVRRTQTNYRPVTTSAPGATAKKKSKQDEYEYYAFADCERHKRIGFNGWKCLDND